MRFQIVSSETYDEIKSLFPKAAHPGFRSGGGTEFNKKKSFEHV